MMFRKTIYSPIFAMIIFVSVFFMFGTTAFASDDGGNIAEKLNVKEVWLTGDTLHVSVSDGSEGKTLDLNLRDYAKPSDEYVTIKATDDSGRESNAITFKNPYYQQSTEQPTNSDKKPQESDNTNDSKSKSESAIPSGAKPLTPEGMGTVVDNVKDGDGKEFFTVETPDGNVFYLIVDRQRDSENVYLLNAVNEDDLTSLAKTGNGKGVSAVPTPTPTATPEPTTPTPEPTKDPQPQKNDNNSGMLGIIVLVLVVVGGVGYYFKIVRPKNNSYDYETEDEMETTEEYSEPGEEETMSYTTYDEEVRGE